MFMDEEVELIKHTSNQRVKKNNIKLEVEDIVN